MILSDKQVGFMGEDIACEYLMENRYKILHRNLRSEFGEIDIVAVSPLNIYVFFEVKTTILDTHSGNGIRQSYPHVLHFSPDDRLTKKKIQKLRFLSSYYMRVHGLDTREYRIDGLCVLVRPHGDHEITVYENIGFE